MKIKPILFNTQMVRAIVDGRKTKTRRPIQYNGDWNPLSYGRDKFYKTVDILNGRPGLWAGFYKNSDVFFVDGEQHVDAIYFKSQYQVGDVLWVRETWQESEYFDYSIKGKYGYRAHKADEEFAREFNVKWRPSIHMPKEAARIFLKVTDIRVERVQDVTEEDAHKEGFQNRLEFGAAWNSIYNNWNINPWVWVIEFERCDKP